MSKLMMVVMMAGILMISVSCAVTESKKVAAKQLAAATRGRPRPSPKTKWYSSDTKRKASGASRGDWSRNLAPSK